MPDSLETRVAVLTERVGNMAVELKQVSDAQGHLDRCMDDTKGKVNDLYDALKMFHSPKEWISENWVGLLLLMAAFALFNAVPNAFAGKLIGHIFGLGH